MRCTQEGRAAARVGISSHYPVSVRVAGVHRENTKAAIPGGHRFESGDATRFSSCGGANTENAHPIGSKGCARERLISGMPELWTGPQVSPPELESESGSSKETGLPRVAPVKAQVCAGRLQTWQAGKTAALLSSPARILNTNPFPFLTLVAKGCSGYEFAGCVLLRLG